MQDSIPCLSGHWAACYLETGPVDMRPVFHLAIISRVYQAAVKLRRSDDDITEFVPMDC